MPEKQGLSEVERKQVRDMLRFLAFVLICVIAAALTVSVVITVFQ